MKKKYLQLIVPVSIILLGLIMHQIDHYKTKKLRESVNSEFLSLEKKDRLHAEVLTINDPYYGLGFRQSKNTVYFQLTDGKKFGVSVIGKALNSSNSIYLSEFLQRGDLISKDSASDIISVTKRTDGKILMFKIDSDY